jgi:pimeloyl-ACP methyl ester carboxylesterase
MPHLRERYRCIRVDLPGFGAAPAPPDADYSPRGLSRAVVGVVDALDLKDVTVVGHSLGGGVALLTALTLVDRARAGGPRRLSGLVSVAGAAYLQREPPFVRLASTPLASIGFALLPKRWLVRTAMRAIVADPDAVTDRRVEHYASPMRSAARRTAYLRCARTIVPPDLDRIVARIPEIDVPALCLWGDRDPVVPLAGGRRLATELPRGRLVVLERCGHQVVEERPRASAEVFLDFLAGADGPYGAPSSPADSSGPTGS